jgi:hypothetical protein
MTVPLFGPNVEKMKAQRDVDGLVKALHDKNSQVRAKAAEALGEIRERKAVEPLLAALKDEGPAVRSAAVKAFGRIGDAAVVDSIISILTDTDAEVRLSAVEALGALGDEKCVDPLLKVIETADTRTIVVATDALKQCKRKRKVGDFAFAKIDFTLAKAAAILKQTRRTRALDWWKDNRSSPKRFLCDVCSKPMLPDSGYLLDTYEVVNSKKYISERTRLRGTDLVSKSDFEELAMTTLKTRDLPDSTREALQLLERAALMERAASRLEQAEANTKKMISKVKTAWLICDQCLDSYFATSGTELS